MHQDSGDEVSFSVRGAIDEHCSQGVSSATGVGSYSLTTATVMVATPTAGVVSSANGTAPNAPVASKPATSSPAPFPGAASKLNLGSFAGAAIAVAGLVAAM